MNNMLGGYEVYRLTEQVGSVEITQIGLMTVFNCVCGYQTSQVVRLSGVSEGKYVSLGVLMPDGDSLTLKKSYSKSALEALNLEIDAGFHIVMQGEVYDKSGITTKYESHETKHEPVIEADPQISTPVAEHKPVKKSEPVPTPVAKPVSEPVLKPVSEIAAEPENTPIVTAPADEIPDAADEIPDAADEIQEPVQNNEKHNWEPINDPSALFKDADIANACKKTKGVLYREENGVTLLAIPVSPHEPFPMMPVFCFGDSSEIKGREYIIFKAKDGKIIM